MYRKLFQHHRLPTSLWMHSVTVAGGLALAYFLCGLFNRLLVDSLNNVVPIWLPSGLLLAILLLIDRRRWPIALLVAFLADMLASMVGGILHFDIVIAAIHCIEAYLAAIILIFFVGLPLSFSRVREVIALGGTILCTNALTVAAGALVLCSILDQSFHEIWRTWWLSSSLGMLLVVPVVLSWAHGWPSLPRVTFAAIVEVALLYLGTFIVTRFSFSSLPPALDYHYQIFPFLLWAAVRFGPRGTTTLTLLAGIHILWNTLHGLGSFAVVEYPLNDQIFAVQGFLSVIMLSALLLAAVIAERRNAQYALQQVNAILEQRVAERTESLRTSNTQLKQQIIDRQRAETFLSAIVQQLPIGVGIAEAPSGRLLMYNNEAVQLFRHPIPPTETIADYAQFGTLHLDHTPYTPHEYPILRAALSAEVVRDEETIYQRGDGTITRLSFSAAPIRDDAGRVVAAVTTFFDVAARTRTEMALRASEARFRMLADNAPVMIWLADIEGRGTFFNKPLMTFTGREHKDLHGYQWSEVIHPDDIERASASYLQAVAAQRPFQIECRALRADNLYRWIFIHGTPLSSEEGEYNGYIGSAIDITERYAVETALRESEERFAKSFYSSPVASIISTLDQGEILEVNDSWVDLVQYERAYAIGKTTVDLGLWVDHLDRHQLLEALQDEGQIRDREISVRTNRGMIHDILFSCDMIALGGEPCIITTLYDISERKRAEAIVQQNRQQLQAILDHAPTLVSLKQLDGRYILVNHHFSMLFNLAPEAMLGYRDDELFSDDIAISFSANDRAVLERGAPLEVEEVIPLDDGIHIYSAIRFPLIDLRGEPYALCHIAIDITERKKLEAQLMQVQKMESVGLLAGGIAHDFNNLLTIITGSAELAHSSIAANDPAREDLDQILKAADRAASLVRQLLTFARRQPIDPYVINVNRLLGDLTTLLRRLIREDISLIMQLAPDLKNVKVDPGQIEQVVINLVVNARDAMPNGGELLIETENITLDPQEAQHYLDLQAGDYVLLKVRDAGVGIPAEVQAHIFEPFFTTKELGKGTGLGLSTCYGIVKQHGGTIYVTSEVGIGTSVHVYLPQVHEQPLLAPSSIVATEMPTGTETILVVEDEENVRSLTVRTLRARGYTVLEAANGIEALDIVHQYLPAPIHGLVTDVVMPQMGGPVVAQQITSYYPEIKVLFMSGYADHAATRSHPLMPSSLVLQKPFTPVLLTQTIRRVLDGQR